MLWPLIIVALLFIVAVASSLIIFRRSKKADHVVYLKNTHSGWTYDLDIDKVILKAGDIVREDFRTEYTQSQKNFLRVVTINIEFGTHIDYIMSELKRLDPDIVYLQQVGIKCRRSHGLDTGKEIAKFLHMNYTFVCEEVIQEGKKRCAVGNAVLTKYDTEEASLIILQCHDKKHKELCKKIHTTPVITMKLPDSSPLPVKYLQCFGLHIEEHHTGLSRHKNTIKQVLDYASSFRLKNSFQIMAGDLSHTQLKQRALLDKAGFSDPFHYSFGTQWIPYKWTMADSHVTAISETGVYGSKLDWILARKEELSASHVDIACKDLKRRMIYADFVPTLSEN
jgi:hypothetical protein